MILRKTLVAAFGLRYFWRRSYYFPQDGVIFLPVPKRASTSIQRSFLGRQGIAVTDFGRIKNDIAAFHLNRTANLWQIPSIVSNSFCFTTVRDPIKRFISAHDMLFTRPGARQTLERKVGQSLTEGNSVDELIRYLSRTTIPDWHFLPQSWFVGSIRPDLILDVGDPDWEAKLAHALPGIFAGVGGERMNESSPTRTRLTDKQASFLHDYYASDYDLLKKAA